MAPKDRGKSIDRSTAWSEFVWDESGQFWWSSRLGPSGQAEYDYRYPETEQTHQQRQETPRSPGPNIITGDDPPCNAASGTGEETNYENSDYNAASVGSAGTGFYQSTSNYEVATTKYYIQNTPGDFQEPTTSSSFGNNFSSPLDKTYSSTGSSGSFGTSPTSPRTSYVLSNKEHDASGEITRNMGALSFSPQPTIQEQAIDQAAEPDTSRQAPKVIKNPSSRGLDPRYRVVPEKDQQKFWKIGRVFMMLWTEPAAKISPGGGSSHFSTVWLSQTAYSEIRRFVVIREGHGSSLCSPIHTYSGQATLKPNLPERQQHAIIYTSDECPAECSYDAGGGNIVREDLIRDPIKVKREQSGPEGELGVYSRLNYSKVYTVENYVRVLKIGMVDKDSLQSLKHNSYINPALPPPEPSSSKDKSSKDKVSKGKGKDKGGERKEHRKR